MVRYALASFEELPSEEETFTVNDSNMMITPSVSWEMDGMFNSFSWIQVYMDGMLEEVLGVEKEEESLREQMLERY